jgi:hypothetical protein
MLNIKLPALYCPFSSVMNQYVEAAGQHSLDWGRSLLDQAGQTLLLSLVQFSDTLPVSLL